MDNKKNGNGLIILVIVLCLLVLCIGGYIVYDKLLSKQGNNIQNSIIDNTAVEGNNDTSNNTEQEAIVKYFYDVKDLKVKALPEYQVFTDISKNKNVVESVDFGFEKDYRAVLDLAGKVTIQKYSKSENDKGITGELNVTGVIDIVQFNIPSMEADQLLYLLTDNGNVYYYRIGDIEKKIFNATKVESVSNVKKIFISSYSKENAGGSWALFAITGNNDCIMIRGESV